MREFSREETGIRYGKSTAMEMNTSSNGNGNGNGNWYKGMGGSGNQKKTMFYIRSMQYRQHYYSTLDLRKSMVVTHLRTGNVFVILQTTKEQKLFALALRGILVGLYYYYHHQYSCSVANYLPNNRPDMTPHFLLHKFWFVAKMTNTASVVKTLFTIIVIVRLRLLYVCWST